VSAAHVYAAGGIYQAQLTVADDDGGIIKQATTVLVVGARLNRGVLEIVGTSQRDYINVAPSHNLLRLTGSLGNVRVNASAVQRIVAHLGAGNDLFVVGSRVRASLMVDGGAGSDRVMAGGGSAMILGGAGNDALIGGSGRDVLIGGSGQDQLSGGGGTDLMIAGTSVYDGNAAALAAILAEWSSSRSLATRSANLRTGSGLLLAGQDIHLKLNETVFDDQDVDSLMGGSDLDWFLFATRRDKIRDKAVGDATEVACFN
jgi:Ca2+-binding RTX toxin-like protein